MWVESSILIGNQPVGLSVHLLEPDGCEQAAAEIAWFTVHALDRAHATDPERWQTFIERVISPHVKFTVPVEDVEGLGAVAIGAVSAASLGG